MIKSVLIGSCSFCRTSSPHQMITHEWDQLILLMYCPCIIILIWIHSTCAYAVVRTDMVLYILSACVAPPPTTTTTKTYIDQGFSKHVSSLEQGIERCCAHEIHRSHHQSWDWYLVLQSLMELLATLLGYAMCHHSDLIQKSNINWTDHNVFIWFLWPWGHGSHTQLPLQVWLLRSG